MKVLISIIFSFALFAQTGIPYYKNGVLTYVNPIGGIIVDVNRKQIRTAINGGLRGVPNQLWSVNSNGDGEAINVDWNVFTILPPGTDGKRTLSLKTQPTSLSVIPSVKIISDRELMVCPECTENTPFVFRSHLSVQKITSSCKLIIPNGITAHGRITIKAINGYGFFASLDGFSSAGMPNPKPTGFCSALEISNVGVNFPDNLYPWYIPIAEVTFDGTKYTGVKYLLTPYYSEDIRRGTGIDMIDTVDKSIISVNSWIWYDPPPSIVTVSLTQEQVNSREVRIARSNLQKNPMWLYQDGIFKAKDFHYTVTFSTEYVILKFTSNINIDVGDTITVIAVN